MGGKVVVHAKVDTEIGKSPGRTGSLKMDTRFKVSDQQIVLTAHLQEEQDQPMTMAVDQPIFWKLRAR